MNQTRPVATNNSHEHLETTVAIIGSGFSGLGMAIQLRRRGRDDFLILEKSHDVGGVWRDNTYPGCGCDVPTAMYSYSFEQNPYLVQDVVFAARDPCILTTNRRQVRLTPQDVIRHRGRRSELGCAGLALAPAFC